jgi:hypothetical protein
MRYLTDTMSRKTNISGGCTASLSRNAFTSFSCIITMNNSFIKITSLQICFKIHSRYLYRVWHTFEVKSVKEMNRRPLICTAGRTQSASGGTSVALKAMPCCKKTGMQCGCASLFPVVFVWGIEHCPAPFRFPS